MLKVPLTKLWDALHRAFHESDTRSFIVLESTIWVLIVLSMGTLVADLTGSVAWLQHETVVVLDRVILWIFVGEYGLRLLTYRPPALELYGRSIGWRLRKGITGRLRYAFDPLMQVDLLTVLALVPALRALRALRLFRLFRSLRFFRYADPITAVLRSFQENSLLYLSIYSMLGLTVFVGGVTIFLTESPVNPDISSVADGLWWTLVTITTVGYGDISPVTTLGRVIGSVLMIAGMFTLALFAGIVGTSLLQAILTLRNESFRMSSTMNHIVVCGFHDGVLMLLKDLRSELGSNGQIIVFARGPRPGTLPPEYLWVDGDPTRESELGKARILSARSVIIVASRGVSPQQADAETILICLTIGSLVQADPLAAARKTPLHVACEILEGENVRHAKKAGASVIVDSSQLGFSMLVRSVFSHGSAESIATLAQGHGHRFYLEPNPYDEPRLFGDISRGLQALKGVNAFGVYHTETHQLELGPCDDLIVAPDDRIVFLVPDEQSQAAQDSAARSPRPLDDL